MERERLTAPRCSGRYAAARGRDGSADAPDIRRTAPAHRDSHGRSGWDCSHPADRAAGTDHDLHKVIRHLALQGSLTQRAGIAQPAGHRHADLSAGDGEDCLAPIPVDAPHLGKVIDRRIVAGEQKIGRGQSDRAAADDGDPLAGVRRAPGRRHRTGVIHGVALDAPDADGVVDDAAAAVSLAGVPADQAAHRGKGVVLAHRSTGLLSKRITFSVYRYYNTACRKKCKKRRKNRKDSAFSRKGKK